MAASVGLEPTTLALTARRSAVELQGNEAPQVGIEPTTSGFSDQRSHQTELPGDKGQFKIALKEQSPRSASNRQPSAYQADALAY